MGCGCGGGGRSGGSRAYSPPPAPVARAKRGNARPAKGAKPIKTVTSANFVVYQRDGSERLYPDNAAGERAATNYAATHGLAVDKKYKKDL